MANILILGESGVGKEMFAQSIHNASPASDGPFVAINCATLTETLLDSELFGYEDGAFTGAKKGGKAGLFEVAHGGTIFLDEIGEMPLFLQAKLLRVLQERSVRRLGGNKNIPIDVRMIFATNRNLVEEVKNKRFREDLYYRINVLSLKLSPLRERKEDIPLLFKNMISNRLGKSGVALAITTGQFDRLQQYDWPGNVRELSNFVDRLIALSGSDPDGERLMDVLLTEFAALPNQYAFEQEGGGRDRNTLTVPMGTLQEIEQSVIRQVNARLGGDKKEMERVLGISTTTLWRRLKELGLS